jgi:hypothetical protein
MLQFCLEISFFIEILLYVAVKQIRQIRYLYKLHCQLFTEEIY